MQTVVDLLCQMIAIDSQSSVSNVPLANFMQSQLEHWDIERIDYVDREGIAQGWHWRFRSGRRFPEGLQRINQPDR